MNARTLIPAALILAVGGAAMAFAAGGDHGDRKARHEARIDRMFERLDANSDGAIDQAEIDAGRLARFNDADTNNDGKVTEAEIAAAAEKAASERGAKMAKRMIRHLDSDDDGALTLAEYNKGAERRSTKMMKHLDADGDGVITKAEAQNAKGGHRHKRKDASE